MKRGFFPAALLALTPSLADAADYTVNFGEVRGQTVEPTQTIKMCPDATGYRLGYEVIPHQADSYHLKTVVHLPAPSKSIGPGMQSQNSGRELIDDVGTVTGRAFETYGFNAGDPLGPWSFDISIDDVVVKTVSFNVVPANICP
ncbi:MAG TPA: hypothetical protein VL966_15510 [Alphaproteobacteria bacterium]|jgi:hypothetical protein|nr:hypothetical protein [Alphaproteobacteria bacterium]